jgi:hypothetical protein
MKRFFFLQAPLRDPARPLLPARTTLLARYGVACMMLLLGSYQIYESLMPARPGWRLVYALVVTGIGSIVFLRVLAIGKIDRRFATLFLLTGCLIGIWFLPVLMQDHIYMGYVIGDATTLACMSLIFAARILFGKSTTAWDSLRLLTLLLIVASIIAPLSMNSGFLPAELTGEPYQAYSGWLQGFSRPHFLILPFLTVSYGFASSRTVKFVLAALIALELILSLICAQRTIAVIAIVVCMLAWVFFTPFRHKLILVATLLVVSAVAVDRMDFVKLTIQNSILPFLSQTRYESLIEEQDDDSLTARFAEARDIIDITANEANALEVLFGHGHGAVWKRDVSMSSNVVDPIGNVHFIHVNALSVFYRYGLLGLGLYLGFVALILRDLVRLIATRDIKRYKPTHIVYVLAALGVIIDSLAQNIYQHPVNSFVIVAYLTFREDRWRSRRGVRARDVALAMVRRVGRDRSTGGRS